jgi:putative ABC transport system permease protein
MSAPAVAARGHGAVDGGLPARRAIFRWAWRLFRREWREQALVLALLTLAVAAAIFGTSVGYNIAPAPGNAEFGTVNHYLRFPASDWQALQADIAYAEQQIGIIDVITHRYVPVPGSVETVEFRTQDPQGPYSAPMLALLAGRYPAGAGEVAVTDGVAETFALDVGASFALDGSARTVVGLVENPSNLNAEFALVLPAAGELPEEVTILVDATDEQVMPFRAPSLETTTRARRPGNEGIAAAALGFGSATVTMLLIALVAAASFVVLAQRRLRQLGMLAAIGATENQLRLVTVANGLVIGIVAATLGTATGLLAWIGAAPLIEPAAGFRIDPLNVPWWLIVTGMLLAVVMATGAAWWPARAVVRIPITLALSGRPPVPKPVRRSASGAALVIVAGVVCLLLAGQSNGLLKGLLLSIGTAATALGILLMSPLALPALPALARRSPIAVRLALRDLARYQDRSAAALAAISLALGIAAATVIITSAAQHSAERGNLADNQLLIRTGTAVDSASEQDFGGPFVPERTTAELERLEAQAARLAVLFDDPAVIPVEVAVDPTVSPDPAFDGRPAVTLGEHTVMGSRSGYRDVTLLYVASEELLGHYGLSLREIDLETEVLTVESGELRFIGASREPETQPEVVTAIERLDRGYSSLPGSFITPEALRRRGWEAVRIGWLIEANAPLTTEQLAAARAIAADGGLTIESRDFQEGLLALRAEATATGMLVAFGILAMTVGLVRSAAASDLRTLTAAGATSGIRRTLTAATAGGLAALGALLGTAGAYLAIIAANAGNIGSLSPIPVFHLLAILVGVPLMAVIGGWLLAGREPPLLNRQPIE